jgi:hypothetical protein
VLVSQLHNGLDDLGRLLLGEVVLGGDFSSDLGFSQSFGLIGYLVFVVVCGFKLTTIPTPLTSKSGAFSRKWTITSRPLRPHLDKPDHWNE